MSLPPWLMGLPWVEKWSGALRRIWSSLGYQPIMCSEPGRALGGKMGVAFKTRGWTKKERGTRGLVIW